MKQNSELRLLESVPIWMVLKRKSKVWTEVPDVGHEGFKEVLLLPGAKCASVGAYVVEGGLSRVGYLLPFPFVDDELSFEMGQELEVLLLLGHSHHLHSRVELFAHVFQQNGGMCGVGGVGGQTTLIPSAFRGRDSQTSSAGRRWRSTSPCWRPACPARSRLHTGSLPQAASPPRPPPLPLLLHRLPSSPCPHLHTPQAPSTYDRGVVRHTLLSATLPWMNGCPTCRGRRSSPEWRSGQTPPLGGERTSSPPARILPCRPGLRSTPPSAARPGQKRERG